MRIKFNKQINIFLEHTPAVAKTSFESWSNLEYVLSTYFCLFIKFWRKRCMNQKFRQIN